MNDTKVAWTLTPTGRNRAYWVARPYVSGAVRDTSATADVLLVPIEKFREVEGPLFYAGTTDFFQFLKEGLSGHRVEVCADDDKYKEFSLHSDTIYLVTLVINLLLAPKVFPILMDYIRRQSAGSLKSADVKSKLILERQRDGNREALTFDYDGPAATFETAFSEALSKAEKAPSNAEASSSSPSPTFAGEPALPQLPAAQNGPTAPERARTPKPKPAKKVKVKRRGR